MSRNTYSELLHNAAEKWGLTVIPGRPLIGLPPYTDPKIGIAGNPYQPKAIRSTQKFTDPNSKTEINLFTFNNQWGYSISADLDNGGFGWGNYIKFSDPYPEKLTALTAAVNYLKSRADAKKDKNLIKWAEGTLLPKQLSFI